MAAWEEATWHPAVGGSGLPRRDQLSGVYQRYVPDPLVSAPLAVKGELSRRFSQVERGIRALNGPGAEGLAGLARFLLRSEAIASSRIEGIAPSAQQIALAELGQSETVKGVSEQAQLVANNMTVVGEATSQLVQTDTLTVDHVVELHRSLMPSERQHHGFRVVQNWIGSSNWTPIGADFVPPAPERVPELMLDLIDYLNGGAHSPLVQAALVHAQFETIHPFTDGNGRVGRALIHTVLARRGLADKAVLPISLVLATLRNRYIDGLTAFRHTAPAGSVEASRATNRWLEVFVDAAGIAAEQSQELVRQVRLLRDEWDERITRHRQANGQRPVPRVDSAVARLLGRLPEAPVVTARTLSRILGVSLPAANSALDELTQAGILTTRAIDRGAKAYIAREVLDLVTLSERALASTHFDTRITPPHAGVPARAERS